MRPKSPTTTTATCRSPSEVARSRSLTGGGIDVRLDDRVGELPVRRRQPTRARAQARTYVRKAAVKPLRSNPELERVILDNPLDPDVWLVYGDWLEEVGDPRGELVAVQARHARDPGNPQLLAA